MAEQVVAWKGFRGRLYTTRTEAVLSEREEAVRVLASELAALLERDMNVSAYRLDEALVRQEERLLILAAKMHEVRKAQLGQAD